MFTMSNNFFYTMKDLETNSCGALGMMPTRISQESVFVQMSGKAEDRWMLYELGFTMVGVECVYYSIEEFFEEHKLTPKIK